MEIPENPGYVLSLGAHSVLYDSYYVIVFSNVIISFVFNFSSFYIDKDLCVISLVLVYLVTKCPSPIECRMLALEMT